MGTYRQSGIGRAGHARPVALTRRRRHFVWTITRKKPETMVPVTTERQTNIRSHRDQAIAAAAAVPRRMPTVNLRKAPNHRKARNLTEPRRIEATSAAGASRAGSEVASSEGARVSNAANAIRIPLTNYAGNRPRRDVAARTKSAYSDPVRQISPIGESNSNLSPARRARTIAGSRTAAQCAVPDEMRRRLIVSKRHAPVTSEGVNSGER